MVNCRRHLLELHAGLKTIDQAGNDEAPFLLLFDGSLIFWHLEAKDSNIRDTFLPQYLIVLEHLYQAKTLVAAYISLPKSKELVNLLRLSLSDFSPSEPDNNQLANLVDAHVASFFLEPGQRTTIFKNQAHISLLYPDHLSPHFFYMDVGDEVIRVELPAWITEDLELVEKVASIVLDQAIKGRGYPVCLAEAHEQAVVKGPDREFFYHVITKIGIEQKRRLSLSQKSIKKRRIGI